MKKTHRLMPIVLLRILPAVVIILLVVWMITRWIAVRTVQAEVENSLQIRVSEVSKKISGRLKIFKGDLKVLAANELVVNGLTDLGVRQRYLPMLLRSLKTARSPGVLILADAQGQPLVSNTPATDSLGNRDWFAQVMGGSEVLRLTSNGLVAAVPVRQAGAVKGLLMVELDAQQTAELLQFDSSEMLFVLLDGHGDPIVSSEPGHGHLLYSLAQADELNWLTMRREISSFPDLLLIGGVQKERAFQQVKKLDGFFFIAMTVDLVALLLGVVLSSLMSTRPLSVFTRRLEEIRRVEKYNDLLPETGPLEFVHLARSFNTMHQELLQEVVFKEQLQEVIEERTRELKDAQDELVNKAIESGRAQLSAMILHNIGNAMTPVGVQLELLKNKELGQIANYLGRCYGDLQDHLDHLTEYVTTDARGQEVFAFLGKLIDSLAIQKDEFMVTLEKISTAVNYVAEIISLQQNYAARERENKQQTDLNQLLEDALKMQASALEKREIMVRKTMAPNLPSLIIEKNKLMQVVVNLIKNAYEAIDEQGVDLSEKWIQLSSYATATEIGFTVVDTGIGIDSSRINTVLEFGESGKGSTGFGLYYCKKFVEANRGRLTLTSEGQGKGASVAVTFSIHTPPAAS